MKKDDINYSELGRERTVTVVDLLREIGRRIWLVIVLAVIFALIFGAYKYYRDKRNAERETVTSEEAIVANTSLTDEEIAAVQEVLYVKSNIEDMRNYVDNSVLMQIDAANESQVALQYRIEVPVGEMARRNSQDLLAAYQSYVKNRMLAADLEESGYGMDVQYLGELISFSLDSDFEGEESGSLDSELPVSASFTIIVEQKNQESAERLADSIEDLMESYRDTLSDTIGSHDLMLINRSYTRVVNTERRTFKYDRIYNLTTMQDKVDELESDFSSAQEDLLNQYEELGGITVEAEGTEDEQASDEGTAAVRISRRYVAVGIVVGIVIALIYIILAYFMRGSINTANDIRYLYNLRVLGEIKLSGKGTLRKRKIRLTKDQQIGVLVANLKSVCQENGIKKILFNGSAKLAADRELAEQLAEEMKQYGVSIEYVTDLPYSADAIDQLEANGAVVLLEKIRYSNYETMEAEIRTCMEHEVQILGTVVFS